MLERNLLWSLSAVLALLIASSAISAVPKWLVTPEEAAGAYNVMDEFTSPVAAKEGPGPLIIVRNPKMLQNVRSPVDILVTFEPGKSGRPPDMGTLNVTLIGFFDIDITDRLLEHIRAATLVIEQAKLPVGSHWLRMSIKDLEGNPNERDVVIRVVEG
ncbi:MAG: hypothetical protein ISR48_08990 [Alphaproteobacteria bacterium]|nr:hypothetical protein [Alphaproteobacteria bacterium]